MVNLIFSKKMKRLINKNKNLKFYLVGSCLLLFCLRFLFSFQSEPSDYKPVSFKLKNGLQVIIVEDNSFPLVSAVIAYGVGSINDPPNKDGLAYLMQNLMFQGSENVGPLQHINYIQNVGGELNAATTFDKTFFYETVPSNQLGLVLWLESERMHFLDINQIILEKEKENLIRNERQRQLDEPFARYFFLIDEILYPDFSYGHSLVGSAQSVKNITLNDVLSFYRRYYVPNNAVLCLSGDLNTQKAKELVIRYFESIPKGLEPIVYPKPEFPLGPSGRDQIMIDPLVSSPAMQFAIRIENYQPEDILIFKIMEQILLNGNSSRLVNRLIRKERVALYLSGGFEERREFQSLKLFLLANNQYMIERSKKILIDELNRLKTEMVSEKEMTKAKNKFKYNYVKEITGNNLSRALALADRYLKERNLPEIGSELAQLERINSYSILMLARKHLNEENYCFITILPR